MFKKLRVLPFLLILSSCGNDTSLDNQLPHQNYSESDFVSLKGTYSLKESDCKTNSHPLIIRQGKALLSFKGGFDYEAREWSGYVLPVEDQKIVFTIRGNQEIKCEARMEENELRGVCVPASGNECQFTFEKTSNEISEAGDTDGDGVADERDNCPNMANAGQVDIDQDGKGDVCDEDNFVCPLEGKTAGVDFVSDKLVVIFPASDAFGTIENTIRMLGGSLEKLGYFLIDSIPNGVYATGAEFGLSAPPFIFDASLYRTSAGRQCSDLNTLRSADKVSGFCYLPTQTSAQCFWVANRRLILADSVGVSDYDHDGIFDVIDNCPENPDPDQRSAPGNLIGEVCTPIPALP